MKRATPAAVRAALPASTLPWVDALAKAGDRLGVGLHVVGGPVRDFLLDRPLRDVDLIAEPRGKAGDAASVARKAGLKGARIVEHKRFRTVRISQGSLVLDLATVRSETYAAPGELPTVADGTLADDLRRRDFTVNALAVPLNEVAREGRPQVIDPGGAAEDLRKGVLRIFHDRSFHDDPTRALRAARLAPRLGFSLARVTSSALRSALRDGVFGSVSGERYRAEIEKLFSDPLVGLDPSQAMRRLQDWHVLSMLEPGLQLPPEVRVPLRRLGADFVATPSDEIWIAGLRVWLGPLPAQMKRRVLRRLAVRGEAAKAIAGHSQEASRLHRALLKARGRAGVDTVVRELSRPTFLALQDEAPPAARRRLQRWDREDREVTLPVNGKDLVAAGLEGPEVGRALERIRAGVLDRVVRHREDALAVALEVAKGKRSVPPAKRRERRSK